MSDTFHRDQASYVLDASGTYNVYHDGSRVDWTQSQSEALQLVRQWSNADPIYSAWDSRTSKLERMEILESERVDITEDFDNFQDS